MLLRTAWTYCKGAEAALNDRGAVYSCKNSYLVQSGFEKWARLPKFFMKRQTKVGTKNLVKEQYADNKGQLFTICKHGTVDVRQ